MRASVVSSNLISNWKYTCHFFHKGFQRFPKVSCCDTVQFGKARQQANPSFDKTAQVHHSLELVHNDAKERFKGKAWLISEF
jgi:hypothetical protein